MGQAHQDPSFSAWFRRTKNAEKSQKRRLWKAWARWQICATLLSLHANRSGERRHPLREVPSRSRADISAYYPSPERPVHWPVWKWYKAKALAWRDFQDGKKGDGMDTVPNR